MHDRVGLSEIQFKAAWQRIVRIWICPSTDIAFMVHGSGRKTFARMANHNCAVKYSHGTWRRIMTEAVKRGWCDMGTARTGHTCFFPKRPMPPVKARRYDLEETRTMNINRKYQYEV